ncbi:MAG: hypothetical protein ACFFCO_08660 [Promethearchaeota archaeon]
MRYNRAISCLLLIFSLILVILPFFSIVFLQPEFTILSGTYFIAMSSTYFIAMFSLVFLVPSAVQVYLNEARVEVLWTGGLSIACILCSFIFSPLFYLGGVLFSGLPPGVWSIVLPPWYPFLDPLSTVILLIAMSLISIAIIMYPPNIRRQQRVTKPRPKPTRKPIRKPAHRWVPSQRQVTVAVCATCGSENNPTAKTCWNCGKSIKAAPLETELIETAQHCVVCSGEIRSRDRVVFCPSCRAQGHRAHMLEYVRVQTACPNCGQSLRPAELVPTA